MQKIFARHFLIFGAVLALTGCFTAESVVEDSFRTGEEAVLIVETFNGRIEVVGSDRNSIDVEVIRRGTGMSREDASDNLRGVDVRFDHDGDTVAIKVKQVGTQKLGNPGADVRVRVPRNTVLDLTTDNGTVSSRGTEGDVFVRSNNGSVNLTGDFFSVDVATTNGVIDVETGTPAVILASSTNGALRFAGPLAADAESRLDTTNGSIWVGLPEDTLVFLDASTTLGNIAVGFDVTHQGPIEPTKVRANIGGSDPTTDLVLRTTNGSIDVVKY